MATSIQNTTSNNTSVAKQGKTMQEWVKTMMPEIKKALPAAITPERFTRMTLSAISSNKDLAACTPKSFLGAMMQAAQLGLEPNTPLGQAYLLPYKNKGVLECQFIIGYKGLIDLAYRSGEVEVVQAHIVYANDTFECQYGLNPKLTHIPADHDRGEAVKVYAVFKTKSGGYGFEVMSMDDVRNHAKKYSKAYDSNYSPWKTNFDEMAKIPVLKKVLKYAPLKSEFVRGVAADGTIKTEISDDMFSVPNETIIDVEYTESEVSDGENNAE